MLMLLVVSVGVLLFALGYTLTIAKRQKALKTQTDSPLPGKVQHHIYMRNPVFISYGIFFIIAILFILYVAITV